MNKYIDAFGRNNTWTDEVIFSQVGKGWTPLLADLLADLFKLGWNGSLYQVKEKYGELRFYIGYGSDVIYDRIEKATTDSTHTCEDCGQPGNIRGRGRSWYKTLCDECNKDYRG